MADIPLRLDADPQWQAIHAAAATDELTLARIFYLVLSTLAARRVMALVRDGLYTRDVERTLQAIPTDQVLALATTLEPILADIARRGATVAASAPIPLDVAVSLAVRLGSADGLPVDALRDWARRHAGELLRHVDTETRWAIRRVVEEAINRGAAPAETAKVLENVIGLTHRQAQAVIRYRASLAADEGLTPARIDRLTSRYATRLLRHRARMIARTETLLAANAGRRAQWERNVAEGVILPDRWVREWVAIVPSDGRTCPICVSMDGERAVIGEPYASGRMGPPDHPACRCTEVLRRLTA
jgi:SPP1 gp7 family putative phage head morphogenesis protein